MTLALWMSIYIPTETMSNLSIFQSRSKSNRKTMYCVRYVTPKCKKKPTRVANKVRKDRRYFKYKYKICECFSAKHVKEPEEEKTRSCQFDSDSFPIGVDNHASYSISNDSRHFISEIQPVHNKGLKGISGKLKVEGIGTIKWMIEDDDGKRHAIIMQNALYVPTSNYCLLSPQHWAQTANDHYPKRRGTWCATYDDSIVLHWKQNQYKRTLPLDKSTNTGKMRSAAGFTRYRVFAATIDDKTGMEEQEHICFECNVVSDDQDSVDQRSKVSHKDISRSSSDQREDENIADFMTDIPNKQVHVIPTEELDHVTATSDYAELLRWHYRLGHMSFARIKLLAALGILPRRLMLVRTPKCAGCLFGSMTKKPWRTKGANNKGRIKQVTKPGQCVSVDQLQSTTPGFIAQLKGGITKQRYTAATVFVDQFSGLGYVHLQRTLSSNDTLEAKQAFEAYARSMGIRIQHYHTDNGRFADNAFLQAVQQEGQTISYCGVNAHFQNGVAEKRIRDLQDEARRQLHHAKARWPEAVTVNLWPYALRNANHLKNTLPDKPNGTCKLQRFAGVQVEPNLKNNHTFACPVYALDSRLASGNSIPKWNKRARLGLNLGPSPRHARSVSLVLNLETGHVSPQFHIRHDEFFETVRPSAGNPTIHSNWQNVAGLTKMKQIQKGTVDKLRSSSKSTRRIKPSKVSPDADDTFQWLSNSEQSMQFDEVREEIQDLDADEPVHQPLNRDEADIHQPNVTTLRRSSRQRKPTKRWPESSQQEDLALSAVTMSDYYCSLHEDDYRIQDELTNPIAFLAKADEDTMYFHQAMAAPDKHQFIKAIVKEVNDHIDREHWILIPRNDVPEGVKILDSVWSMKRKRDIKTREVHKWKARLNVHGGQQEYAVNFFETYSPVVNWFSVRLFLVLAILHRWKTRQVDFVLAFPQADIEFDLYMNLPKGIQTKYGDGNTHVLKLQKNLYGQRQAGRVWVEHLKTGLMKAGFEPSLVDECVFYRGKTIFMFYVDDGIFMAPTEGEIDKAIKDLKTQNYDIEDKGNIEDYLGINIEYLSEDKIKLSQPHLIEQIIKQVDLNPRVTPKETPGASTKILHYGMNLPDFDERYHYRSIIGKLNFLEKGTRPDLAYYAHQCARFSENPKVIHGKAVDHIVKYLIRTKDDGLIFKPTKSKCIKVYADADF